MLTPEFRAGLRRFWLAEFNASTVYERFVDEIEHIEIDKADAAVI